MLHIRLQSDLCWPCKFISVCQSFRNKQIIHVFYLLWKACSYEPPWYYPWRLEVSSRALLSDPLCTPMHSWGNQSPLLVCNLKYTKINYYYDNHKTPSLYKYSKKFNGEFIPLKLPWIFPGAALIFNGAPGNIQGNLTGVEIRIQQ